MVQLCVLSISDYPCLSRFPFEFKEQWQLTREIHVEHGKPLSLANAQTSREVVASAVILPEKMRTSKVTAKNTATPSLPVFENRSKYGRSASRIESRVPMVYSIVTSITNAIATFAIYGHHIARGTISDASLTSSATP